MVTDFLQPLRDAGYTYSELQMMESDLRRSKPYWKASHPQHQQVRAQIEAVMRMQSFHDSGRAKAAIDQASKELEGELEDLGELTPAKKRQILTYYGPKEGRNSPKFRESLPPNVRKVIDEKLGPPTDRDVDAFGQPIEG